MPFYWKIKYLRNAEKKNRLIKHLGKLREKIKAEMPVKTRNNTLVLGTWNIRNFDDNRFMEGPRMEESFYYIAEIVSRFDILAVQEINEDLTPINKVLDILGPDYEYMLTDITEGRAGNQERLGFIYDRSKVKFKGIAGEVVLPDKKLIEGMGTERQFSRTPFACAFQSGWFKFMFATVHIYFGEGKGPKFELRVKEIETIAQLLAERADKEDYNYILVGDFNIEDFEDRTFDALEENGFKVFKNKVGSNKKQTRFYDQISFKERKDEVRLIQSDRSFGVFNFFDDCLFTPEDFDMYKAELEETIDKKIKLAQAELKKEDDPSEKQKIQKSIEKLEKTKSDPKELKTYYQSKWITYQMSDHFPLWVELEIDFADDYLESLKKV